MEAHAAQRKLAKRYGRSRGVFCCRPVGETSSRLVTLIVDPFESPKISAELAFDRCHSGWPWIVFAASLLAERQQIVRASY
jgi:hypothetical protein